MRLYLSSYKFGNHPEELARLVGANKRTFVIMNATDSVDDEWRAKSLQEQFRGLRDLGLDPTELDLRQYFGREDDLRKKLKEVGLVWIRGGNVFILKRAFEQSGFDKVITEALKNDELVYAGFSAGVCIATPTLRGVELVDSPDVVPPGYKADFGWDGLGLIPYNVAVHYKSDHPESPAVDNMVAYYEEHHMPYKPLHDGEVIVVNGEKEKHLI